MPVLLIGCGYGGKREGVALGVPAHRPSIAGVDDRAAELADAVECRGQVSDGEVGQRCGIAGARSTLVYSQAQAVGIGLPPGPGRGGPWREGDPEDSVPEPAGAIRISAGNSISGAGIDAVWPSLAPASPLRERDRGLKLVGELIVFARQHPQTATRAE